MTTVLMIDDDASVVATVREYLAQHAVDTQFYEETDFGNALARVRAVRPDVLILDVYRGTPASGEVAAQPVWVEVWNDWFCPLLFYSAGEVDVEPVPPQDHPFVRMLNKGSGSEIQILSQINAFKPHIDALRSVEIELGKVAQSVMRDVSKHVFSAETDEAKRKDMMVRVARRRIAARMDHALTGSEDTLHAWEQYLHPPFTSHLVLGDVLRLTASENNDRCAYRLILSPTCDLANSKIESVLAAKCCDPGEFVTRGLNLTAETAEGKLKKGIKEAINDFHRSGISILPEYPGVLPMLGVDYRTLELIPAASIALADEQGRQFQRVASIDSPFREFVAWAFLQICCRPGVPPRNMNAVIDALAAHVKQPAATEGAS